MPGSLIYRVNAKLFFSILFCFICFVLSLKTCYGGVPSSVVFIIDNSQSNQDTDPDGLRFVAVENALNEIQKELPDAKVGLVLFGSRLWFYKPDNEALFVSVPNDQFHGGNGCYIPPLDLDCVYAGTFKSDKKSDIEYMKSGIDVLKMYLETEPTNDLGEKVRTNYTPTHKPGNFYEISHSKRLTNITRAFDAANQAHLYESSRSEKSKQVTIFLSDGMAGLANSNPDFQYVHDYKKGENTPTTFTVSYNASSADVADLNTMTSNIKNNGYSTSNDYSELWLASAEEIESVLVDSILAILFDKVVGKGIDIQSPNGVENITGGSTETIKWVSNLESDSVTIEYTIDSAKTWTTIASEEPDLGTFEWDTPFVSSKQCKVRITSMHNPEIFDESDDFFSINSDAIIISSPNGSEKLFKGSDHVIRWETSIDISTVKLEYTKDSAKTWKPIAVYVPDTGAFTWRIPDVSGEFCKVKITSNDNDIIYDESDNFFQILNGSLLIEKPNGGDTLYMGQNENIIWSATGEIGNSKLEYSLDNGSSWHLIESATENDGGYIWTIPDTTSNTCKVRVESNIFSAINDESDNSFVILKPTISVTSPNWGEVWQGFDLREIRWDSKGITGNVTLSYSIGDSLSWVVSDTAVPNSGTYNWRVPNQASEKCWVKISHNKYPSINDINDYPFIIEASDLDLVSITADPISATLFEKDSLKLTITAVGQEPITYQWQKNGTNIAGATTTVFELESMSAVDSGAYRCIATNPLGSDTSSVAHIALKSEFIRVIYPNGGEDFNYHFPVDVTWESDIRGYNVSIEYSIDSGSTWEYLVEQTEDDGEFQWNIKSAIQGEKSFLRITSHLNSLISDLTDSSFLINSGNAIIVTDSSSSSEKLLVYPNPVSVTAEDVKIAVPSNLSGTGELTICDNLGATLDFQRFEFTNGATLSWDLRNSGGKKVSSGSYVALLQVIGKKGEVSRYKVLFGVEE